MKKLLVAGVTQISDLYPNVRYKLKILQSLRNFHFKMHVFDLGTARIVSESQFGQGDAGPDTVPSQSFNASAGKHSGLASRIRLAMRMLRGHISVIASCRKQDFDILYIPYPGIFLVAALALLPSRWRREIYLDAFISVYDTVVNDRAIFPRDSLIARLLYSIERKAFKVAHRVIVDTPENAAFYSELFALPAETFVDVPLSIPPLNTSVAGMDIPAKTSRKIRCLFMGTFVPLQGCDTLVRSASQLARYGNIEFVFIGDGQEAHVLERYLENNPANNLTWHRGSFPTDFVKEEIFKADICLGVFSENPKTQRVLPYKLYYYLSLGKTVITAETRTVRRILRESGMHGAVPPVSVCEAGNARQISELILDIASSPEQMQAQGKAARDYFEGFLSESCIRQKLTELFTEDPAGKRVVREKGAVAAERP